VSGVERVEDDGLGGGLGGEKAIHSLGCAALKLDMIA
jgi:hypothetical protein